MASGLLDLLLLLVHPSLAQPEEAHCQHHLYKEFFGGLSWKIQNKGQDFLFLRKMFVCVHAFRGVLNRP